MSLSHTRDVLDGSRRISKYVKTHVFCHANKKQIMHISTYLRFTGRSRARNHEFSPLTSFRTIKKKKKEKPLFRHSISGNSGGVGEVSQLEADVSLSFLFAAAGHPRASQRNFISPILSDARGPNFVK